ncbi:hypothetical protein BDQ12DRAFT_656329 [Crucibulum laeve]|uniref:Uncharacterized protein n=1 Tax=Crucibulum laeve TaxID=68775 RepID=A0A5C3LQ37_9AGAR|nr:hypothetical protein BDQ12DRAFT_656329 [Crucibulum laeve]
MDITVVSAQPAPSFLYFQARVVKSSSTVPHIQKTACRAFFFSIHTIFAVEGMDSGSLDNHSESHSASNRMQLNAGYMNASLSRGTAGIEQGSGISVRSREILDTGGRGYGRMEAERPGAQTEAEHAQDNTKSFGSPAPAPVVETSRVDSSQHEYAVRSSTDTPSTSQTYPSTTNMRTNIIPAATDIQYPTHSGGYTAPLSNSHLRQPATYSTPEYQTQPPMQPTRSLPAASSTLEYQNQSPMQPTRSLPTASSSFPLKPSTGATAGSQPQSYSVRPHHSEPAAFYGSTDAHNGRYPFIPAPVRRPTVPPGLFNAYVANDPFKSSISHRVNSRHEDVTTFDDIPVFAESHSQPVSHQYPPAPYPPFQQPLSQTQRPSSQVQYPSGAQSHSLPAPNTQLPSSSQPTRHDGGSMPSNTWYTPPNQGQSNQPPVIPYIPPEMETYEPHPWPTYNRLSQVPLGTYPQETYDPSAQIPIIQEPSAHFPMSIPPIANSRPPPPSNIESVRPIVPPIRPMDPQIGVYQPPYDHSAPTSPVNRLYDSYDPSYIPFIPPLPNQYPPPTFVNDDDKLEPGIFKRIVVGLVRIPKLLFKSRLDSYHNNFATAPLVYTPHSHAWNEEKTEGTWKYIIVFAVRTLPEQVYLHLLLRLPSLYFGRVARIFEEADMTLPEIKKMALETASRGKNAPFANMNFEPENVPPAYESLKHTWENFIDSVMREWKTFNIVSVLLLSAILTILQIESAAADPVTRYTALFSLICALISLLYGCMYIIRFGSMRKTYKAAEWALEAKKSKTVIWWNVWVLLAMPAIWLTWSIILYIVCIMSFVWRTGSRDDQPPEALSAEAAIVVRIVITVVLCLGTLYGILIVTTFRRYGDAMDRAWKNRIDGWLMEKPFSSYQRHIYPTSYHQPSHYPIFGDSYTQASRPYQSTVPAWNRPPSPSLSQYGGYPIFQPTQRPASPPLQPLRYVPGDSYGFDLTYKHEINPNSSRPPTNRTPYLDPLPEVGLTRSESMNSMTTTVVPSGIHPIQHKDWNTYPIHPIPGYSQSRSRSPSPSPPPLPPRPWAEDPLPAENLTSSVPLKPTSRNRDTTSPCLPTSNPSISRDSPLLRDDNLREARVHFRNPLSSSDHNAPTVDTDTTSQASAQPSELHDRR